MKKEELITTDPEPQDTQARATAKALIHNANAEFWRRIHNHQRDWSVFWNSPVTPDEILAEMGTKGKQFVAGSRKSLGDIFGLVALIEPDTELFPAKLEELFPQATWYPRRELIEHEDGTVTLAPPAEGHDAWGNPIPEEE